MAPRELFEQILEYCPIPTFDLVIELPEESGVVVVRRIIEPYKNVWALPGLRMYKPEEIDDVIGRVARAEVGLKIETTTKRLLGQFVGKFKTEHSRQDISTGYVVRALSTDIELNRDHFSSHRIIKKWDEVPAQTGAMYRYYLAQYFGVRQ